MLRNGLRTLRTLLRLRPEFLTPLRRELHEVLGVIYQLIELTVQPRCGIVAVTSIPRRRVHRPKLLAHSRHVKQSR